jgi:hypothetical protein
MLYREIIAVCSPSHTKQITTLCGQNEEFFNVKTGGIYSYQRFVDMYQHVEGTCSPHLQVMEVQAVSWNVGTHQQNDTVFRLGTTHGDNLKSHTTEPKDKLCGENRHSHYLPFTDFMFRQV